MWTAKVLEQNESIPLTALSERLSSAYQLSVMEEQTFKNRQEFTLQVNFSFSFFFFLFFIYLI
jgi:hypothetical protein